MSRCIILAKALMQSLQATSLMQQPGNLTILTDEELQILAAKESPEHFRVLYEKYYSRILKFVYQRVVTKDEAFDITQQVFLQAMLSLGKYELKGFPFSSWLYRIALNELNQAFRKNKKQRGINLGEGYLKGIVEELDDTSNEEKEAALLESLTHLEEEEFQLIEMRFFEKRPFSEIGEILEVSEASAKMRLYRILEKLKPVIAKNIGR
jgi:RNA polymerase sigma-70 factor (ECF subfamily)